MRINRLCSNHEQRGCSRIPWSNQLRTAACQRTTTADLSAGRIAPRISRILVVVSLGTSHIPLPEPSKNKIIFTPRVGFACVAYPVRKVGGLVEAATSNLAPLPSILAARNWAWRGAMFVVLMEADIARPSQSRAC